MHFLSWETVSPADLVVCEPDRSCLQRPSTMQHAIVVLRTRYVIACIVITSYCAEVGTLSAAHLPRTLLQSQSRGSVAASTTAALYMSDDPGVEQLVLQHTPPRWGPNTLSARPAADVGTPVPVRFSIYYPANASSTELQQLRNQLPVLFLLNGANVESEQYSTLARLLNSRGYVFVASDYYQPVPAPLRGSAYSTDPAHNWTRPTNCPADKILAPSAALFHTFINHINSQKPQNPAFRDLDLRGLVLVGHSYGGAVAFDILDGQCSTGRPDSGGDMYSYCEGYQPPLWNRSCAGAKGQPGAGSSGSSSSSSSSSGAAGGLIRGAVLYEGYRAVPAAASDASNPAALVMGSSVFLPTGVNVAPGMFVLHLSSQTAAPKVQRAYDLTNVSTCSCAAQAVFPRLNHFGINNYQPNTTVQGIRQVTPCGRPGSSDPVGFRVSEAHQNEQLHNTASLIDGFIRAELLGDVGAKKQLQQLAKLGNSSSSEGFRLQLKQQCL